MGFNGINALASRVLMVLQPRDTLLLHCDILKIEVCPGNDKCCLLEPGSFIQVRLDRYITMLVNVSHSTQEQGTRVHYIASRLTAL